MNRALIRKYNVPGPRYTSYPTVPYWDGGAYSEDVWKQSVRNAFWNSGREVSLYLHLPFCESLCTYCGCNTRITKNHNVEDPYISAMLKEWELYQEIFPQMPVLKEMHLGGGTPTFFPADKLEFLINALQSTAEVDEEADMSFEAHPNNTKKEHLQVLYDAGFRRMSLGIQDFDMKVQQAINRIQPHYKVKVVTQTARAIGFNSINFDLIYGLPHQSLISIEKTINKTLELMPDRIAFYGYAHVPWMKPAQRSYEEHLPSPELRQELYEKGKEMLLNAGYVDIGMDHFALPHDELAKAYEAGSMHRNFMGYTTQKTSLSIGLGMSAISDSWTVFSQNHKDVKTYQRDLEEDRLPLMRGHQLIHEDLVIRKHILNLMCTHQTSFTNDEMELIGWDLNTNLLLELMHDELVEVYGNTITITEKGKPLIRNICMALDVKMWRKQPDKPLFSKTV